MLKYNFLD